VVQVLDVSGKLLRILECGQKYQFIASAHAVLARTPHAPELAALTLKTLVDLGLGGPASNYSNCDATSLPPTWIRHGCEPIWHRFPTAVCRGSNAGRFSRTTSRCCGDVPCRVAAKSLSEEVPTDLQLFVTRRDTTKSPAAAEPGNCGSGCLI